MVCVFNQFAQERPLQLGRRVHCHPMLELTRKKKKEKKKNELEAETYTQTLLSNFSQTSRQYKSRKTPQSCN